LLCEIIFSERGRYAATSSRQQSRYFMYLEAPCKACGLQKSADLNRFKPRRSLRAEKRSLTARTSACSGLESLAQNKSHTKHSPLQRSRNFACASRGSRRQRPTLATPRLRFVSTSFVGAEISLLKRLVERVVKRSACFASATVHCQHGS